MFSRLMWSADRSRPECHGSHGNRGTWLLSPNPVLRLCHGRCRNTWRPHLGGIFPGLQYVLLNALSSVREIVWAVWHVLHTGNGFIRLSDKRRVDYLWEKVFLNSFVAASACHGNIQRIHTGRRIRCLATVSCAVMTTRACRGYYKTAFEQALAVNAH